MLRRAPILAVACLLVLSASAFASLPGTPTITVGITASCWVAAGNGGRGGGGGGDYCTYSGIHIALNGWTLKKGVCAVTGTYPASATNFTAQLAPDSGSYAFTTVGDATTAIDFQFSCPLTWTGSAGLSWGKAITGGTSATPIWTLHVRNHINQARQAHCVVSYRNDLNQTQHYTWSPTIPADGLAKTRIRVWHVNSLSCTYTLTRTAHASGSAPAGP